MSKRIIQIKLVLVAIITLFMYNQCGNPYVAKPTELQFTDNSVQSNTFQTDDSLKSFEDSVYQVTRQRCAACHTTQNPTHAHADSQIAHDIVIDQFKVNFANVASSRLVAKIRDENHGCWSDCLSDSQEMQAAVQVWADKIAEIEEENNNNNTTGGNGGNTTGTNGSTGGSGYMEEVESADVFETTVYAITRQRCIGCHNNLSPRHANDDVIVAHDIVVDNGLVNFNNINNSRLVQRLSVDAHQCWNGDCAANAVEMATAIQAWKDALAANNNNNGGGNTNTDPMTTSESDTVNNVINGNGNNNTTITIPMANGTFTAPFVFSGGADGYLWAPGGSGNNYDANANNVGLATYNFNVPSSGSYRMSGMVEAVPNSDDSFYMSVDNENFFDWHIPPSTSFQMQEVSTGSNRANKVWNLSAGNHTLTIKQREDNTKVKYITVYPSTQGGSGLGPGEALLTYDLSGILNTNEQITFQVKVMIYDDYSYKFWDPEIITNGSNVLVQNVQLLINGYYNPQHSAYTIVNKTVTPGDGSLASHALLALKDQGEAIDKISFKFGVLQISN